MSYTLQPTSQAQTELRRRVRSDDTILPVMSTTSLAPAGRVRLLGEGTEELVTYTGFGVDAVGMPTLTGCTRGTNREQGGSAARSWPGGTFVIQAPYERPELVSELNEPTIEQAGRQIYLDDGLRGRTLTVVENPDGSLSYVEPSGTVAPGTAFRLQDHMLNTRHWGQVMGTGAGVAQGQGRLGITGSVLLFGSQNLQSATLHLGQTASTTALLRQSLMQDNYELWFRWHTQTDAVFVSTNTTNLVYRVGVGSSWPLGTSDANFNFIGITYDTRLSATNMYYSFFQNGVSTGANAPVDTGLDEGAVIAPYGHPIWTMRLRVSYNPDPNPDEWTATLQLHNGEEWADEIIYENYSFGSHPNGLAPGEGQPGVQLTPLATANKSLTLDYFGIEVADNHGPTV